MQVAYQSGDVWFRTLFLINFVMIDLEEKWAWDPPRGGTMYPR